MQHSNKPALLIQRSDCGFTLVELTIVLLVMVLIASIAAPTYYNAMNFRYVEASARRVQVDLELVKQLARETGSPATLSFDVASESYRVPPLKGLAAGASSRTLVDLGGDPYHCDVLTAVIGGQPWVTFDRFGMPHSDGGITLQSGGHTRTVLIDSTGETRIEILESVDTPPEAETPISPEPSRPGSIGTPETIETVGGGALAL